MNIVHCPYAPKGGSKTQNAQNLNNKLLSIGIPTSLTSNNLERRNSPYFAFLTEFACFASQLRHTGGR